MANTLKFGNGEWYGKKDTILAYNDENNNYKPLPFDFSRDGSATRVNKDGLIETVGSGEPRIDYKDDSKGALKLEPSKSNLIEYSEDFTSGWALDNATLISNSVVSPDGTQNATTLIGNTVNSRHHIRRGISGSVDASYSFFAKYKELRYLQIASVNSTEQFANFDIKNGVIGLVGTAFSDAKIEDYGNGWYRCSVVSINQYNAFYLSLVSGLNATWLESWVMPNNTDGLYIWGAQLEQGSYATSYIPTQGGVVTRLADSCSQTVPDGVIGQTEGTIYFETEINGLQGGDMRFQLSDGSTNNWIFISSGEATGIGVKCRAYINNGNVNQFNAYSEYLSAGKHKYALAYNQNDIALYVDGVQVALDTSATIPSLNEITLGGSTPTSTNSSHFLKYDDLKLYNTRLSNSELQALTSN